MFAGPGVDEKGHQQDLEASQSGRVMNEVVLLQRYYGGTTPARHRGANEGWDGW